MYDLPNIKSAIKRVAISKKKAAANAMQKSALRTAIKKAKEAIARNDEKAPEIFKNTVKTIDKASAHGLIHKNTAARKKSRLAKLTNKKD